MRASATSARRAARSPLRPRCRPRAAAPGNPDGLRRRCRVRSIPLPHRPGPGGRRRSSCSGTPAVPRRAAARAGRAADRSAGSALPSAHRGPPTAPAGAGVTGPVRSGSEAARPRAGRRRWAHGGGTCRRAVCSPAPSYWKTTEAGPTEVGIVATSCASAPGTGAADSACSATTTPIGPSSPARTGTTWTSRNPWADGVTNQARGLRICSPCRSDGRPAHARATSFGKS